jgi:hypothetical protein
MELLINQGTDRPCVSPVVLADLMLIASYASTEPSLRVMLSLLIKALSAISSDTDSVTLASQAMRTLADVFDEHPWTQKAFSGCTLKIIDWDFPTIGGTPSYREADLRLRGYALAKIFEEVVSAEDVDREITELALAEKVRKWTGMVKDAASENNVSCQASHLPLSFTTADPFR